MSETDIVAIVLAAGASSRFGANKLLLPFGETVVVRRVLATVREAGLDRIVVVTGHQSDEVRAALHSESCEFVHNPRHREGEMISSIQAGLRHLQNSGASATLIVLGDQPLLPPGIIGALLEAYRQRCGDIVAPKYREQRGHPVLLARRFWDEALRLPDATPMRFLLRLHADDVATLLVNTDAVLRDVDTPALYEEALRKLRSEK